MSESQGTGSCGSYWCTEQRAGFSLIHSAAILLLLLVHILTGCTSLQPVAMDPEKLQEEIRGGNAIHEGESVRVVTRDGVSRLLVVTGVEENTLHGHSQGAKAGAIMIEIPVDDIILLETEKVNAVDTTASSLGVTAVVLAVALIIAPLAILGALGI